MRTLEYDQLFSCTPLELFRALHTPSAIRVWWEASAVIVIPEPNGAFAAVWGDNEDDPDYVVTAVLSVYDPPHRSVFTDYRYYAKLKPLEFKANFVIQYRIYPHKNGARLFLTHSGIPSSSEADEYYRGCDTGWQHCLSNLHTLLSLPKGERADS